MATGTKIGDTFIAVSADTSQYEKDLKGIEKTTDKSVGKVNDSIGSVGVAGSKAGLAVKAGIIGGVAVAGAAIVDFADDSLKAFSNLNESINAVNVSYGENAEAVLAIGESSAQSLGLATADFNQLSVAAASFTEAIASGTGQEVPQVLDDLTTRVADFASVMNIEVADAFTKFRSGLAGESEPLRQFGIDVSAAAVEQQALASGLIVAGEEMTEAEKVTARYLTIMEQTEKVSGDFAATADEAANKQRILNAELENARAELGEGLLPLQEAWLALQEAAIPILSDVATEIAGITGAMSDLEVNTLRATGSLEQVNTAAAVLTTIVEQTGGAGIVTGLMRSIEGFAQELAPGVDALDELRISVTEMAKELPQDEIDLLTENMQEMGEEFGLTQAEIDLVTEVLEEQRGFLEKHEEALRNDEVMLRNVERAMGRTETATEQATTATEEATTATFDYIAAQQEQHDLLRAQIDPMFGLWKATQDLAEADQNVADVLADSESTQQDYIDALIAQAEAGLDLQAAMLEAEGAVKLTEDAFRDQLVEMGLTIAEADVLIEKMKELDEFAFAPKDIRITVSGPGGEIAVNTGSNIFSAAGGPARVGETHIVGEDGPEFFVPKVDGTIIPNDKVNTGFLGNLDGIGGNTVINVTIPGVGTSSGDAARVAQILNTLVRA